MLLEFTGQLIAATVLLDPLPEMAVVVVPGGIVEVNVGIVRNKSADLTRKVASQTETFACVFSG